MKAFLSHASEDKDFVGIVATQLGRQYCIFDEQSFASGNEFKESIINGLNDSTLFVRFASKNSLKKFWVKFEIEEASYKKIQGNINKAIVYIIDNETKISDIPEWLCRTKIVTELSPQIIARDIKLHLDKVLRERQRPYFIGRTQQIESIESLLLPVDGSNPPHVIYFSGLPGIGRRSIIYNIAPKLLNLHKSVEIRIQRGDSINDICARIADKVEPYSRQSDLQKIIDGIQSLTTEEANYRSLQNIQKMIQGGELPVLYDDGGLLDSEGYISTSIQPFLQYLIQNDSIYFFIVCARKPHFPSSFSLPGLYIPQLSDIDSKRLISLVSSKLEVPINQEYIDEIADYVSGYPPAIYFAIRQAKTYGLSLLIRDKVQLKGFLTSAFLKYISGINLNDIEKEILLLLATYSPLPLQVISDVIGVKLRNLDSSIIHLIDYSLVVLDQNGYYRISDPVKDSVVNIFGFPEKSYHEALSEALSDYLSKNPDGAIIELYSILFRAAKFSDNKKVLNQSLHFASDLIELTEIYYHQRDYSSAIEIAKTALEERPNNVQARNFLIRALVQIEKWKEAERQINILQRYVPLQDVKFLLGFLNRKARKNIEALGYYKEAEKLGFRAASLWRELALCNFLIGDQEEANNYIKKAIDQHPDSKYILDLWAKIASKQKNEKDARNALASLQLLDTSPYFYHRVSCVELEFGNISAAKKAAETAFSKTDNPPLEVRIQLIMCNIADNDFDTADKLLSDLHKTYGNLRRDLRVGLGCKILIARGKYKEALDQNERNMDKSIYYKNTRRDAIQGLLLHNPNDKKIHDEYQSELETLNKELSSTYDNFNLYDYSW